MSIEWLIYLADISCGVKTLFGVVSMGGVVIGGVSWIIMGGVQEDVPEHLNKLPVKAITTGLFLGTIAVFIPSERTIYMMAGAHYGMEALQSETAQKVAKLLNGKLDAELAKLGEGR